MSKFFKGIKYFLIGLILFLLFGIAIYIIDVNVNAPEVKSSELETIERKVAGVDHYTLGENWLKKNEFGTWEMYLEGSAYDRGIAFGKLTKELHKEKEAAFIAEIGNRVPNDGFLTFLKYVVGWINRDLDDYIPEEYLKEIYGASKYMSDSFDYVGPKYNRILNYHAAHDIGHALQNMNLVGCTAFASWDEQSDDSLLLIGRNFDFYFGQQFAKDKIIAYYNPDKGYKFMSVTWACFSGVVSGMNEHGLTVTLNSAKSTIPLKGKTPVSIIARDILQYASTIEEAYEIANKYESFVSESFLIGSRKDKKVGLIEKTKDQTGLMMPDTSRMIVTNHFQGEGLVNLPENIEYRNEGVSDYRFERVELLMDSLKLLNPQDMALILRDRSGLNGDVLGMGNEKAVNQLIAHHSIIFSPYELTAWVATAPYSLGEFVEYDLNSIFNDVKNDRSNIDADPFLFSKEYTDYEYFLKIKERIQVFLSTGKNGELTNKEIERFIDSNDESFLTYYYLGDYYRASGDLSKAIETFKLGLHKNVARESEKRHMEEALSECLAAIEK
ncbi:C45 family autoproteolytic acyltransferase/hydrolase [Mangrovivirga sp. M17]|uniref:C45 family autoproteolytic acyltransferase/hydrolase n=1 Tax=Mangrovivirga halotolerans TaxID=2993936 RepID=A0ABT3RVK0_9BACT|nr:C45 family peptidase [Mangrovivirga halotolerans]MCX2745378.1 C45 family autoproteolytic acyltransferase/hydrolase [Mangrovivirga halotolerans]